MPVNIHAETIFRPFTLKFGRSSLSDIVRFLPFTIASPKAGHGCSLRLGTSTCRLSPRGSNSIAFKMTGEHVIAVGLVKNIVDDFAREV